MGLPPFFCHNGVGDPLATPPPAHCGIPPYQLDPKTMGKLNRKRNSEILKMCSCAYGHRISIVLFILWILLFLCGCTIRWGQQTMRWRAFHVSRFNKNKLFGSFSGSSNLHFWWMNRKNPLKLGRNAPMKWRVSNALKINNLYMYLPNETKMLGTCDSTSESNSSHTSAPILPIQCRFCIMQSEQKLNPWFKFGKLLQVRICGTYSTKLECWNWNIYSTSDSHTIYKFIGIVINYSWD